MTGGRFFGRVKTSFILNIPVLGRSVKTGHTAVSYIEEYASSSVGGGQSRNQGVKPLSPA